jgi:hypothetical protein
LELDPVESYAWVVYDPAGGDIPLPNDLARDADAARLALPIDADASVADAAWRGALNELDAWPTTFPVKVTLSEAVDPSVVDAQSVQVWEWGATPRQVPDLTLDVSDDGREIRVLPPLSGWSRGGRYAVFVRGGEDGLRTPGGLAFGPDAAMSLLRSRQRLDVDAHTRAVTGDTRAERTESAAKLEVARQALAPWWDVVAPTLPREEVSAAWTFSVTDRVEIAFDRESQRIPLPFDLLIDPATGLVDLAPAPWDTPLEVSAKEVANTLRGFGLSAEPFFELTDGVDPSTATSDTVQLWDVTSTPVRVPSGVRVMREEGTQGCKRPPYELDCRHIFVTLPPDQIPLAPAHTYAVVVTEDLRDLDGRPVVPMSLGQLVTSPGPLVEGGRSTLAALGDDDAARVESARLKVAALLDQLGRDGIAAAWPFTTMDPLPALRESAYKAETLGLTFEPNVQWRRPASSLLEDDALDDLFPPPLNPGPALYAGRVEGIRQVVSGSIRAPDYLDDVTRTLKADYDLEKLNFWAAVPEGYSPERKLPVVIFGHAIVTDRRFLVTIAGELNRRGFVVVGVDFPYHGERLACVEASLVAVPNFFPEELRPLVGFEDELIWFPPCASGDAATCAPTGECLDERGRVEPFANFPIIDMQPVSGAAFLDTQDIPHIPDHFHQALIDLSSLVQSLRTGDWERALGQRIDPDQLVYVGQSLGSIIGTVWVGARDDVSDAVFNVPGSNMVDLFRESVYFRPQIDDLFRRLEIPDGSYEQERLFQVASWLVDTVDPHSLGEVYRARQFPGLIQIDKVDDNTGDIIIPNFTSENLARVTGMELETYRSSLHADLIVPLLGDAMLRDLGAHLGSVPR